MSSFLFIKNSPSGNVLTVVSNTCIEGRPLASSSSSQIPLSQQFTTSLEGNIICNAFPTLFLTADETGKLFLAPPLATDKEKQMFGFSYNSIVCYKWKEKGISFDINNRNEQGFAPVSLMNLDGNPSQQWSFVYPHVNGTLTILRAHSASGLTVNNKSLPIHNINGDYSHISKRGFNVAIVRNTFAPYLGQNVSEFVSGKSFDTWYDPQSYHTKELLGFLQMYSIMKNNDSSYTLMFYVFDTAFQERMLNAVEVQVLDALKALNIQNVEDLRTFRTPFHCIHVPPVTSISHRDIAEYTLPNLVSTFSNFPINVDIRIFHPRARMFLTVSDANPNQIVSSKTPPDTFFLLVPVSEKKDHVKILTNKPNDPNLYGMTVTGTVVPKDKADSFLLVPIEGHKFGLYSEGFGWLKATFLVPNHEQEKEEGNEEKSVVYPVSIRCSQELDSKSAWILGVHYVQVNLLDLLSASPSLQLNGAYVMLPYYLPRVGELRSLIFDQEPELAKETFHFVHNNPSMNNMSPFDEYSSNCNCVMLESNGDYMLFLASMNRANSCSECGTPVRETVANVWVSVNVLDQAWSYHYSRTRKRKFLRRKTILTVSKVTQTTEFSITSSFRAQYCSNPSCKKFGVVNATSLSEKTSPVKQYLQITKC